MEILSYCQKRENDWYDGAKMFFLSIVLFCAVGIYTVAVDVKRIVFAYIVGREYLWIVRIISTISLIPAVCIYSKLVNRIKRYQLLCLCSGLHVVLGLIAAYCIGDPEIGIANTVCGPHRLFGWVFYIGLEMYYPFVISVIWAFVNSVNSPDRAIDNYGWMVVSAKFGGMSIAGLAWLFLYLQSGAGQSLFSDSANCQALLLTGSLLLCIVPAAILIMIKVIPAQYLHGYEVAYQLRNRKDTENASDGGGFSGLNILTQNYYAIGIFCIVFLHGLTMSVLSYLSIGVAQAGARTISQALQYLIEIQLVSQAVGLLFSIFSAGVMLKKFNVRCNLLLVPCVGASVLGLLICFFHSSYVLLFAVVVTRSVYFSLTRPLLEMLYTPTVDDIKFKSRVWIDSFGPKFSRTVGSIFNMMVEGCSAGLFWAAHALIFSIISIIWLGAVLFLGKKFESATSANQVIGNNVNR